MNTHKRARLTYARRLEMVRQMIDPGLTAPEAAALHGVTAPTARKWFGRYLAAGEAGLADASSRPRCSPRSIEPATALLIVELRRRRLVQSRIARSVGVSESTVARVLARAGLSRLEQLDPIEPVKRYEHAAPGEMLHIDTKKLGRIVRPGHRVTGNQRDSVDGAGWEVLFVAIDDHARVAFTAMHENEKTTSAVRFLDDAVAHYARLGVSIKRLLTDNGSAFRSKAFARACLSTADQRQGGTLHPVGPARVDLRLDLRELRAAHSCARQLATPLQLAPTTRRYQWRDPNVQIPPTDQPQKQRLDG